MDLDKCLNTELYTGNYF